MDAANSGVCDHSNSDSNGNNELCEHVGNGESRGSPLLFLDYFRQKACKFQKYFVYLHRQKFSFGYPGRIPKGVSLYRPCSILKVTFGWLLFFKYLFEFKIESGIKSKTPTKGISNIL